MRPTAKNSRLLIRELPTSWDAFWITVVRVLALVSCVAFWWFVFTVFA